MPKIVNLIELYLILLTKLLKNLYKVYVRPLVDLAAPVWNPYLKSDIKHIEKVQRRFTKMHPKLRKSTFEET